VECLIAGMIMTRYIYRLEPAGSLPAAAFEAAFAHSLQQAITGPVPTAAGGQAGGGQAGGGQAGGGHAAGGQAGGGQAGG
jgi:hypothetical protein